MLKDGLGSVIDVVDHQGNRLQHFVYSAYGQIVDIKNGAGVSVLGNPAQKPALDTPFTYAGLQYEKETGLYYASARFLNPDIGRWLQKDSDPGSLGVPITVTNAYVYAGNSPFNLSDPSGTSIFGDILAAVVVIATVVAVVATAGALGPVAGALAGAGIGAVGGGLAGGIFAASNGGSFASGFLAGALIGAAAGAFLGAASGAGALSAGTGASGDEELLVDSGGGGGGGGGGLGGGNLVSTGAPAQPAAHAAAQAGVTVPQSTGALSDTLQVAQSAAKPVGDGVAGGGSFANSASFNQHALAKQAAMSAPQPSATNCDVYDAAAANGSRYAGFAGRVCNFAGSSPKMNCNRLCIQQGYMSSGGTSAGAIWDAHMTCFSSCGL